MNKEDLRKAIYLQVESTETLNHIMLLIDEYTNHKPPKKKKLLLERKEDFRLKVNKFEVDYGLDLITEFYYYWTEHNEGGKKMKFEMQKVFDIKRRLVTWSKNQKRFNNDKSNTKKNRVERFLKG